MFAAIQILDCLLNAIPKDFWLEQAEKSDCLWWANESYKNKIYRRVTDQMGEHVIYTTNYLSENPFCLRENSDLTLEDQYKRACVFAFRISESWSHRRF